MAKKIKKKPRTDLANKIDISKPVPLEALGTENDPCFGKHQDPRASECQRCGDSEICLIVMSQKNHIKRLEIEEKSSFKDIEETKIPPGNRKELKIEIKKRIKEMIRKQGPIEEQLIINDIYGKYLHDGFTQRIIAKIIQRVAEKSPFIHQKENKFTWKKSQ
jgi:hypothetical protein